MNTQQIACFIQVADNLNFSKAAEKLFVSVATISRSIRLLEAELGCALFIRDKHRVLLTPAGQAFYGDAQNMLHAQELAKLHIAAAGNQTLLKVGCTSQPELSLLADALALLRHIRPNVVPQISCDTYAKMLDRIRHQELDLMLGSDNMAKEDPMIRFIPLCKADSYALIPKKDALSRRESISFQDLEDRVLIHLPETMIPFCSRNSIKKLLALHQTHVKDIECDSAEICAALVQAGYGITILPEYKIAAQVKGCEKVPIIENEPFGYGILTGPTDRVPAARELISILRKQMVER